MLRYSSKVSKKAGLPPGTLMRVGEKRSDKTIITVIDYSPEKFEERIIENVEELYPYKNTPEITWINVIGIDNIDVIEKIGSNFGLHPLVLEDILNTNQRPKMEDFGNLMYIVLKMLYFEEEENDITSEQVSLILGENYVISFQEAEMDVFNPLRERIRKSKGRIRTMGSDYLAYSLLDAIIDNYFLMLEKLGEYLEDTEKELIGDPDQKILEEINYLKGEMIFLRKAVWPLREVISNLERRDSPLIQEKTVIFLRDLYDHTIQIIDTVETYKEMLSGMVELYLSSVSNRMNEVMKILTIIATIFIPLTFIAGIYGMNFEYMPELQWRWGYPAVWFVMTAILLAMVYYFRKKKWL
ncbi:magnesium transporter [Methanohalophilus levihalophilus]|uniref:magnesium/cobalt transporter CorA n=1 Tax=Methanohalophilus levihalophilus TaxID=1431282 RepID=UPI001FD89907|nr:magnesium/cobalt transporter CorA [Methanohalophilus levihalophilus]MBP2029098.1 magnesium transporter [Methanohalophilus levihalophilus]